MLAGVALSSILVKMSQYNVYRRRIPMKIRVVLDKRTFDKVHTWDQPT